MLNCPAIWHVFQHLYYICKYKKDTIVEISRESYALKCRPAQWCLSHIFPMTWINLNHSRNLVMKDGWWFSMVIHFQRILSGGNSYGANSGHQRDANSGMFLLSSEKTQAKTNKDIPESWKVHPRKHEVDPDGWVVEIHLRNDQKTKDKVCEFMLYVDRLYLFHEFSWLIKRVTCILSQFYEYIMKAVFFNMCFVRVDIIILGKDNQPYHKYNK